MSVLLRHLKEGNAVGKRLGNLAKIEFVALIAVIDRGFVLHVAKRAIAVMGGGMWIGIEFLCFFSNSSLGMTLDASRFIRKFRIFHIRSVTDSTGDAASDMAVSTEIRSIHAGQSRQTYQSGQ